MDEQEMTHEDMLKQLSARVSALEDNRVENKLTLGLISGDLDYTMAAFIIALGASVYDMEVDMFFTFWATAALRDPKKKVSKKFLDKMFGWMLPNGTGKLPLSKMQMGGMGPKMIKSVMKMHGAKSLEELFDDAAAAGIKIHVCTMSMDIMGIKREELIDYPHMDFVGVGSFIDFIDTSKQCWFM